MKTSNEKHLHLLQVIVHNNPGLHPKTYDGETCHNVVDIDHPKVVEGYPRIIKMRIVNGWFFSKVLITIDPNAEEDAFQTKLQITNKDIRETFKKAEFMAQANMELIRRTKAEKRKNIIDQAIDNGVKDPL